MEKSWGKVGGKVDEKNGGEKVGKWGQKNEKKQKEAISSTKKQEKEKKPTEWMEQKKRNKFLWHRSKKK